MAEIIKALKEGTVPKGTLDRLLSQREVKEITGFSDSKLEQDRGKGKGIPWVRIGRAIRYRESAVIQFCESLTQEG